MTGPHGVAVSVSPCRGEGPGSTPGGGASRVAALEAEVERLREELRQSDAMAGMAENKRLWEELRKAEPVLVAADRLREAYVAMLEGRDIGRLEDWSHASPGEQERS